MNKRLFSLLTVLAILLAGVMCPAAAEELWLNPGAKDHGKRGKLRIGSDVYCGYGWPGKQGLS